MFTALLQTNLISIGVVYAITLFTPLFLCITAVCMLSCQGVIRCCTGTYSYNMSILLDIPSSIYELTIYLTLSAITSGSLSGLTMLSNHAVQTLDIIFMAASIFLILYHSKKLPEAASLLSV